MAAPRHLTRHGVYSWEAMFPNNRSPAPGAYNSPSRGPRPTTSRGGGGAPSALEMRDGGAGGAQVGGGGGGAVGMGGATVGIGNCGNTGRSGGSNFPSRVRDMYVTRTGQFEAADVAFYPNPFYLTSLYVRLSPLAALTGSARVRVWDTISGTTLSTSTDKMIWESEQMTLGGSFFWEPPPLEIEVHDCGQMKREIPLGPYFEYGIRVQIVDDGAAYAVVAGTVARIHSTFIRS